MGIHPVPVVCEIPDSQPVLLVRCLSSPVSSVLNIEIECFICLFGWNPYNLLFHIDFKK